MKCLVCGKDLPEQAKFCDSCGARIVKDSLGDNGVYANTNLNNSEINSNDKLANANVLTDSMFTKVDVVSGISNIEEKHDAQDNVLNNNSFMRNDLNSGESAFENTINNSNEAINFNNSANNSTNMVNLDTNPEPIIQNNFNNLKNQTNNVSDTIDSSMIKKKKSNKTPIILIIVLLLVAIITGLAVWFFMFMKSSPKDVFTTGIRNITSKLLVSENTTKYTTMTTTFDIKSNIKTTDDSLNQIFNITNNIGIKGSVSTDYTNKIINGNINVSYGKDSLTNVVVYGENSNLYLQLQGLYDKYISMPVTGYDELFNTNLEELKNVKNGIDNAFEAALKDKYLSKENRTLEVAGSKKKVNASILTLDSKTSIEFSNDFKAYLVNDSKFVKAISTITKTDESSIKSALSAEVTESFAEGEKLVVTIYTTGANKFAGVEFKAVSSDSTAVVALYKVDENNYEIVVKDNEESYSCNLNIKDENDSKTYTISTKEDGNSIAIAFGLNTKYNQVVNKLDVSNSISYTALTEADSTVIQNNLMQNKAFMEIMNDIYTLSGNLDI